MDVLVQIQLEHRQQQSDSSTLKEENLETSPELEVCDESSCKQSKLEVLCPTYRLQIWVLCHVNHVRDH